MIAKQNLFIVLIAACLGWASGNATLETVSGYLKIDADRKVTMPVDDRKIEYERMFFLDSNYYTNQCNI
jgi:hypothetical protein